MSDPIIREAWDVEYGTLYTLVRNQIVRALEDCYAGADSADSYWTEEGWANIATSRILGLMRSNNNLPPYLGLPEEPLELRDVYQRWSEEVVNFDETSTQEDVESLAVDAALGMLVMWNDLPEEVDVDIVREVGVRLLRALESDALVSLVAHRGAVRRGRAIVDGVEQDVFFVMDTQQIEKIVADQVVSEQSDDVV